MIEFGSDFHYCGDCGKTEGNEICKKDIIYFADGRQALQYLIHNNKWKRIWLPAYFCYNIVDNIKQTGIKISFYDDLPLNDDDDILVGRINFKVGDVLLRMNYFGLRRWRDNRNIGIPVIEDHSHDLIGEWVMNSNADWCIASLRKTLPIPEGGALWSPKKHFLSNVLVSSMENELLSYKRLSAMLMKTLYLSGIYSSKDVFRSIFQETEEKFETLPICSISEYTKSMLLRFDMTDWYRQKNNNWKELSTLECKDVSVLIPESVDACNPFSMVLRFKNKREREIAREKMIINHIYPAVLWDIPSGQTKKVINTGHTLLSIHCDARYAKKDINQLKNRILNIIQ